MRKLSSKQLLVVAVAAVLVGGGFLVWKSVSDSEPGEGFVSGNGRVEATEFDISTKLPGRIDKVLVEEGDFVKKGQLLASMQIQTLDAQLKEAEARYQEALNTQASMKAQVVLRQSDKVTAQAVVAQRKSELTAIQKRFNRVNAIAKEGAISAQELDDNRAQVASARAAVTAAQAQVASAQAAIDAAKAQSIGSESSAKAAEASIARIKADIEDSQLIAPKDGRIQYRVAQPGEILPSGGKVLSMIDLTDVYLTFFLPEEVAGKVAIDSEVRVILDAEPDYVIPAKISFVASSAQFTPKTVETKNERQKLMFRVKAYIDRDLLLKHPKQVKTGLPGIVWVKTDPNVQWPANLKINVPQ